MNKSVISISYMYVVPGNTVQRKPEFRLLSLSRTRQLGTPGRGSRIVNLSSTIPASGHIS
jgi:hypothetical protein